MVPIWIYNTFKVLANVISDSKIILQRDIHCVNKSICMSVCVCVYISVLCWGGCTYTQRKLKYFGNRENQNGTVFTFQAKLYQVKI